MKNYIVNDVMILTPTLILILQDYCMKDDNGYFFMIYNIFITFVKLFLRKDGVQNLNFEDFEESFFVVSKNDVIDEKSVSTYIFSVKVSEIRA
jgi:hypothetical protein